MSWLFSLFSSSEDVEVISETNAKNETKAPADVEVVADDKAETEDGSVKVELEGSAVDEVLETKNLQESIEAAAKASAEAKLLKKSKKAFLRQSSKQLLAFFKADMEEKSRVKLNSKLSFGKSSFFNSISDSAAFFEVSVDFKKEEIDVNEFCYEDHFTKKCKLIGKTNLPSMDEKLTKSDSKTSRQAKILNHAKIWLSNTPEYINAFEKYQISKERYVKYSADVSQILC